MKFIGNSKGGDINRQTQKSKTTKRVKRESVCEGGRERDGRDLMILRFK